MVILFLGDNMRNTKYERIANNHKAPEKRLQNASISFFSGGLMGLFAEGIIEILCMIFGMSRVYSATFMIVFFIFLASLFTAFGFFDKWVTKYDTNNSLGIDSDFE